MNQQKAEYSKRRITQEITGRDLKLQSFLKKQETYCVTKHRETRRNQSNNVRNNRVPRKKGILPMRGVGQETRRAKIH